MKNNLINNSENLIEKKIDWLNIQNEMKSKFGWNEREKNEMEALQKQKHQKSRSRSRNFFEVEAKTVEINVEIYWNEKLNIYKLQLRGSKHCTNFKFSFCRSTLDTVIK